MSYRHVCAKSHVYVYGEGEVLRVKQVWLESNTVV